MFCKLVPVPQGLSELAHLPVSVPATLKEHLTLPSLSLLQFNMFNCLSISLSASIVLQKGLALGYSCIKCSNASLSVDTFCLPFTYEMTGGNPSHSYKKLLSCVGLL